MISIIFILFIQNFQEMTTVEDLLKGFAETEKALNENTKTLHAISKLYEESLSQNIILKKELSFSINAHEKTENELNDLKRTIIYKRNQIIQDLKNSVNIMIDDNEGKSSPLTINQKYELKILLIKEEEMANLCDYLNDKASTT
jgi:hypothetical protein